MSDKNITREGTEIVAGDYDVWQKVDKEDLLGVSAYLQQYGHSQYAEVARAIMEELRERELAQMRDNTINYPANRLKTLLQKGVFTEEDIINLGVATHESLRLLREVDWESFPNFRQAIEDTRIECRPDATDVFFFGSLCVGKSTMLCGLSLSKLIHFNTASPAGPYIQFLRSMADLGLVCPRTPGNFVPALEASAKTEGDKVFKFNFITSPGEEFVEINSSNNDVFDFKEMKSQSCKFLCNDNRKIIFLVIDPTCNTIQFCHERISGYDEVTGQPISYVKKNVLNQQVLITHMVDLLNNPVNADLLKKVDAIHLIITRADRLGATAEERQERIHQIVEQYHEPLDILSDICKKYRINPATNYQPMVYTHSIGRFYIGNVYVYDSTDSDELVRIICESARQGRNWFAKILNL